MVGKNVKYYRVKYQGVSTEIMRGNEVALLQQSGASVKVLRKATKEEYEAQFQGKDVE
jgi:hypothetical protein